MFVSTHNECAVYRKRKRKKHRIDGVSAPLPPTPIGHQQKMYHIKMLLVAARHHNSVVFITQQQWKMANETIAD